MNTNKKTQNANTSTAGNNSSVFDKDEVFEFIDNGVREKISIGTKKKFTNV